MKVEESVKRFKFEDPALTEEENQLSAQVFESVKKKLTELKPIIDIMKDRGYHFTHPSLSDGISTPHGVIIGRNASNRSEIYTVSKNTHFFDKVDGYSGEIQREMTMPLEHFVKVCDLEFLGKSLAHIEGFLEIALKAKLENIEDKRKFIEQFGN